MDIMDKLPPRATLPSIGQTVWERKYGHELTVVGYERDGQSLYLLYSEERITNGKEVATTGCFDVLDIYYDLLW